MAEAIRLSRVVSLEDAGSIPPGPVANFVRYANHLHSSINYISFTFGSHQKVSVDRYL